MKTITTLSLVGSLAFAGAAFADGTTTTPTASQQCKTERAAMGTATFGQTYGTNANRSNAFGKCVSKRSARTEDAATAAKTNASKTCTAEETADPAAFKAKYGTGKKGANAHGKCVSQAAKAETASEVKAQTKDDVTGAKGCKSAKKADAAAFAAKYGSGRNAFGKCVSQAAKAKAEARQKA